MDYNNKGRHTLISRASFKMLLNYISKHLRDIALQDTLSSSLSLKQWAKYCYSMTIKIKNELHHLFKKTIMCFPKSYTQQILGCEIKIGTKSKESYCSSIWFNHYFPNASVIAEDIEIKNADIQILVDLLCYNLVTTIKNLKNCMKYFKIPFNYDEIIYDINVIDYLNQYLHFFTMIRNTYMNNKKNLTLYLDKETTINMSDYYRIKNKEHIAINVTTLFQLIESNF